MHLENLGILLGKFTEGIDSGLLIEVVRHGRGVGSEKQVLIQCIDQFFKFPFFPRNAWIVKS